MPRLLRICLVTLHSRDQSEDADAARRGLKEQPPRPSNADTEKGRSAVQSWLSSAELSWHPAKPPCLHNRHQHAASNPGMWQCGNKDSALRSRAPLCGMSPPPSCLGTPHRPAEQQHRRGSRGRCSADACNSSCQARILAVNACRSVTWKPSMPKAWNGTMTCGGWRRER